MLDRVTHRKDMRDELITHHPDAHGPQPAGDGRSAATRIRDRTEAEDTPPARNTTQP
jgi:hypothetical protein